ncbi:MICOS complex subunit MIC60 [Aurantiacibacter odishensis]|uniref:MICOS complex subunit MIC60 n=1 Tax=Aurantiacibacter odishensis TaxID=1155476 RepID=UPI001F0CDCDF|nr:MICOS complex subunit MIC60 [Aurantiacibacter odishensis]
MDQSYEFPGAEAQRRSIPLRPALIGLALAFLLGILITLWLARDGDLGLGGLLNVRSEEPSSPATTDDPATLAGEGVTAPQPTPSASASAQAVAEDAREAVQRVEQVVEQQGGLDSRVAAMEQRLTRLDLQSQAAAGNAARAEGLLIAFASRRAIERGAPLGYLADQLRLRFGEARPNAVQTVIDAAQDPVTLDRLVARLEGLAPILNDAPADEGVFTRIGRELSSLFVVRRENTPSPVAERRLERARMFLDSGRIEAAVQEVRSLPNAVEAEGWIADAERFAAAQRALETLETAAVLDPRGLRDSEGETVQQLSPVLPGRAGVN